MISFRVRLAYSSAFIALALGAVRVTALMSLGDSPSGLRKIHLASPSFRHDEPTAWSRPLFAPADKAAGDVTGSIAGADMPGSPNSVSLLGVVADGPERTAVVRFMGKVRRVHMSETVGPWTLVAIGTRDALLSDGSRQETLVLDPPSPR